MKLLFVAAALFYFGLGEATAEPLKQKASMEEVAKAVKLLVEREFYRPATFPDIKGDITDQKIDSARGTGDFPHNALCSRHAGLL